MKKRIANILNDSLRLYITHDCDKQTEAVAMMVIFDIINLIVQNESLGKARIDYVKQIATLYEIDLKI